MADKPQESPASRSPLATDAIPPRGASPGRDLEPPGGAVGREVAPGGGPSRARVPVSFAAVPRVIPHAASAVLGGALLSIGLRRRSPGGAALALAGGGLLFRSIGGVARGVTRRGARVAKEVTGPRVLERSITIQKPASELYRDWRVAENQSKVMGALADVTTVGPDVQRWKVRGPLGRSLEWDAHVVEERPGELLRWESLPGAAVPHEGWVRFRPAPGDWGTVVTLHFQFTPPGGVVGDAVVKLLGAAPDTLVHMALRRFKSLAETGEIPTTGPNPAAREGGRSY
jgi:uncharacterized membrane protein